jgi:methylated-DNA-[protein]-cysteine S-methyltransferase
MTQLDLTPRPADRTHAAHRDAATTAHHTAAQHTTIATPDGPFTIVLTGRGILASGWTADVASLVALIHPTLRPTPADLVEAEAGDNTAPHTVTSDDVGAIATHAAATHAAATRDAAPHDAAVDTRNTDGTVDGADTAITMADAIAAVAAYYNGDLTAPGRLPVQQVSGEFRMHAWDVLRDVAPGERITYAEYASRAGRPTAVRAAAGACALNAAALFVPCHRVLRTDGTLGGFRYGLEVKERLLEREAVTPRA